LWPLNAIERAFENSSWQDLIVILRTFLSETNAAAGLLEEEGKPIDEVQHELVVDGSEWHVYFCISIIRSSSSSTVLHQRVEQAFSMMTLE
jgi:hypothetical protein